MEKYVNEYGKLCHRGVSTSDTFTASLFHEVDPNITNFDADRQWAFHSNLGSLTILDRRTGFGYRDVETGFRCKTGKFWLASGGYDVRHSGAKTIGDAIYGVLVRANTCVGV